MNFFIRLATVQAAIKYDYSKQTDSTEWNGFCNPTNSDHEFSLQQSPVVLEEDKLESEVVKVTLMSNENITGFEQEYKDAEDKLYLNLLPPTLHPSDIITFQYKGIMFSLDHIHSHWGKAEHVLKVENDGDTDGCFHLVFKGESQDGLWTPHAASEAYAVIEVRVKFDAGGNNKNVPRCPNVSGCIENVHPNAPTKTTFDEKMTIFKALGLPDATKNYNILHYIGSLTTPTCVGPVQWFVVRDAITIYDEYSDNGGCKSFSSMYPQTENCESEDTPGNYRSTQEFKATSKLYRANFVESSTPDDDCKKTSSGARGFLY